MFSWETWRPAHPTVLFVGEVAFGLTFFERSEFVEARMHEGKYLKASTPRTAGRPQLGILTQDIPTGLLSVRAYSPYPGTEWEREYREQGRGKIRKLIPAILADLASAASEVAALVAGAVRVEAAAEAERDAVLEERTREAERQREQMREKRLAESVVRSQEELRQLSRSWADHRQVEAFLLDAEHQASLLPEEERLAIEERVRTARRLIGEASSVDLMRAWRLP